MTIGKYCKAYPIAELRAFSGWTENAEAMRPDETEVDGEIVTVPGTITDDTFLFVQDTYVVTDGVPADEFIVFDNVTPEWKQFCHDVLDFRIPEFSAAEV